MRRNLFIITLVFGAVFCAMNTLHAQEQGQMCYQALSAHATGPIEKVTVFIFEDGNVIERGKTNKEGMFCPKSPFTGTAFFFVSKYGPVLSELRAGRPINRVYMIPTEFEGNGFCGDGICQLNLGENYFTCPEDCS